jgi:SAM-dependent methyltransferase
VDSPQIFGHLNDIAEKGGDVYTALQQLPVDVVADLMLEIPPDYAALKAAVPRMPADDEQDAGTGNHGYPLLYQSCAFVHAIENGFLKYTGRELKAATILDYGCGWGRLLRLMHAHASPSDLFGCDPWQRSLDICRDAGLAAHLALCDYLPEQVPFAGREFDLIYAFSVFTHLSRNTADTVLAAMRKSIKPNGLLAITIRPISYWWVHEGKGAIDLEKMQEIHRSGNYAFTPHDAHGDDSVRDADGLITYGDASFSFGYIKQNWIEWELVGTDISLLDPYQLIVFLKPKQL